MFVSIKYPLAHLENGDSRIVVFEDGETIYFFDDLTENSPRWNFGTYDSRKEAIDRVKEMVNNEGWELYETTEEELKTLVEV